MLIARQLCRALHYLVREGAVIFAQLLFAKMVAVNENKKQITK